MRPDGHPERLAGFGTAQLEVEVGYAVGGAIDAEDLADHAEFERGNTVQH